MERLVQRGGARIGRSYWFSSNATWRCATLEADRNEIVLTSLEKSHRFPRDQILRIVQHTAIAATGIQIEHTVEEYPPFILFWSFNFPELRVALTEFGYKLV